MQRAVGTKLETHFAERRMGDVLANVSDNTLAEQQQFVHLPTLATPATLLRRRDAI